MCINLDGDDILNDDKCNSESGLTVEAHYAFASDIDTPFPTPPPVDASTTTYDQLITVTDDFVMKTGKYFHKLEGDLDAPNLTIESVGNLNNLSAVSRYVFRQSGFNPKLHGWLNANLNRDMVFRVYDRNGNARLVGHKGLYAKIESIKYESGKASADDNYIEFTVYAPGGIAYIHTGLIPLKP